MSVSAAVRSQYRASLEMLKRAIVNCPAAMWDDPQDRNRFWQVAYHTLFFTHLYLQDSLAAFRPWAKHRKEAEGFAPATIVEGKEAPVPYTTDEVLEYLAFVEEQVDEKAATLDPGAPSGFHWLPFEKLELQFYNMRHIHQHVGELMERLGARAGVEVGWVSQGPH